MLILRRFSMRSWIRTSGILRRIRQSRLPILRHRSTRITDATTRPLAVRSQHRHRLRMLSTLRRSITIPREAVVVVVATIRDMLKSRRGVDAMVVPTVTLATISPSQSQIHRFDRLVPCRNRTGARTSPSRPCRRRLSSRPGRRMIFQMQNWSHINPTGGGSNHTDGRSPRMIARSTKSRDMKGPVTRGREAGFDMTDTIPRRVWSLIMLS